jgi:hypothetical protein
MDKRIRVFAAICAIILLGWYLLSIPQERLLHQEEYSSLESYPTYYYTNFTVASSDPNAKLSYHLNVDSGNNFSSYMIYKILYQLQLEQFEEDFNATEARNILTAEEWDLDDIGAFFAGGGLGDYTNGTSLTGVPIQTGTYVFIFWIEPDAPMAGWFATLTFSLRTTIL